MSEDEQRVAALWRDGVPDDARGPKGAEDPRVGIDSAPIDWPARFRAAAEVATDARLHYALHGVGAALHELADTDPEQVEVVGRAVLGENTETGR